MEKRIRQYLKYLEMLSNDCEKYHEDESLKQKVLTQIDFFQHERLIHLIVTMTFALLTILSLLTCLFVVNWGIISLTLMFLVLLVPYIRHYYILENSVQKMYRLYDKIWDHWE